VSEQEALQQQQLLSLKKMLLAKPLLRRLLPE